MQRDLRQWRNLTNCPTGRDLGGQDLSVANMGTISGSASDIHSVKKSNLFIMVTTKLFSTTRDTFERQEIKFVAFFKATMFSKIRQLHPTKTHLSTVIFHGHNIK